MLDIKWRQNDLSESRQFFLLTKGRFFRILKNHTIVPFENGKCAGHVQVLIVDCDTFTHSSAKIHQFCSEYQHMQGEFMAFDQIVATYARSSVLNKHRRKNLSTARRFSIQFNGERRAERFSLAPLNETRIFVPYIFFIQRPHRFATNGVYFCFDPIFSVGTAWA